MKKRKKNNRLSFLTAIVCLLLFAGVLFLGMKNYEPEKSENPVQGVNSESSLKGYLGKGYAYAGSQEDASTGEESSFEEQAQILEDEPEEEPEKKKEEVVNMCKAWDDHKKSGIQEGMQRGMQQGRLFEIYLSVQEGDYSAKRGAEKAEMSLDEFEKAMSKAGYKIPELV